MLGQNTVNHNPPSLQPPDLEGYYRNAFVSPGLFTGIGNSPRASLFAGS